jgi:hypothetical protein
MIDESAGKELEGNDSNLINIPSVCLEGNPRNTSIRIFGTLPEARTKHLSNTSLEQECLT